MFLTHCQLKTSLWRHRWLDKVIKKESRRVTVLSEWEKLLVVRDGCYLSIKGGAIGSAACQAFYKLLKESSLGMSLGLAHGEY
eukprot:c13712_g1_i1 orf=160-408(+)